ncbi:unnamed protein product [Cylicocyclus nassatus]|uniref:Ground-like domain-containing protein n=1 Tax=Cylicocyclus nassatus TaxID=53992 RepID=A0AA36GCA9_CYLNA|nr:unnamed protein product [Cylicocyclus nassatus]
MLPILLLPLLLLKFTSSSSVVQTSLCCCGCIAEPCPVVGPSCPSPKHECKLSTDFKCSDLQKLWEDSLSTDTRRNTIENKQHRVVLSSQTDPDPIRIMTGDGLTILESGERGERKWQEVVVPTNPQMIPQLLLNPNIFQGSHYLPQDGHSGHLPRYLNSTLAREPHRRENNQNENKATFERLETMIAELQAMLKEVKQNVLEKSTSNPDLTLHGGASTMDPVTKELEKKAIEDVMARMRKTFMSATHGARPMKEVDSSISAAAIDVQSPLRYVPSRVRVSRASESVNSSNCNDLKLRQIITENIKGTAQESKRAIQKAAEMEYGGVFNAICSPCEFSFLISSQKYCDGMKDQGFYTPRV